jgi:hypothetical protein
MTKEIAVAGWKTKDISGGGEKTSKQLLLAL